MITATQRSEIFRASNAICKQKKIGRSKALTAAWMAFKCEDIFALMLVRRYNSPRKAQPGYATDTNKRLSLFKN